MRTAFGPLVTNANPENSKFDWFEIYDFGDDQLYRSKKFNNGDFDYYILKSVRYNDNWDDEDPPKNGEGKYLMGLYVIAPSQIPKKERDEAVKCQCRKDIDRKNIDHMIECYFQYGCGTAIVCEDWYNDLDEANIQMGADANITNGMFGFIMNRPLNGFGATGWDLLKCNLFGRHKE